MSFVALDADDNRITLDPAQQPTLAAILAKLSSDPATQTTLAQVLAKISSDPATQTTLAAILGKLSSDPATQTTLAAILAKLSSDPASQTTLAAILTKMPTPISGRLPVDGSGVIQPVSVNTLPLPTGASTETTLLAVKNAILALSTTTTLFVTDGVTVYIRREAINDTTGQSTVSYETMAGVAASPTGTLVPYAAAGGGGGGTGDASASNQVVLNTEVGSLTETAPANDTASSGLNGRLQRIAQRISTLIGVFPGSLDASGGMKVAITADASGSATAAGQVTLNNQVGAVTETAPSTDTGSSGLNGRLQRIAQRISSLITLVGGGLPSALGGAGGLQVEVVAGALQAGPITETDRSGTITAGNTAQNAAGANAARRWLVIHNVDAAENFYYRTTGTAVINGAGSICVPPYGTIMIDLQVPAGAVSVIAATTGHKYTVVEG